MARIQRGPRRSRVKSMTGSAPGAWDGRLRLWVDVNGRPALGPGKVRLLEAIAATHSLAAAAKRLDMSYRLAWSHLRILESRTGVEVVEHQRGGPSGGGTELTPEGRALLHAYRDFRAEVEGFMQGACERRFARWSPHGSAPLPG